MYTSGGWGVSHTWLIGEAVGIRTSPCWLKWHLPLSRSVVLVHRLSHLVFLPLRHTSVHTFDSPVSVAKSTNLKAYEPMWSLTNITIDFEYDAGRIAWT